MCLYTLEIISRASNSFIVYWTILNMKSLLCRDAGFDCDYIAQAESDYELFTKGQKHAFNAHGIKKQEFIPAFNEKMRSLIKET